MKVLAVIISTLPAFSHRPLSFDRRLHCMSNGHWAIRQALRFGGHGIAAAELNKLANVAFAHKALHPLLQNCLIAGPRDQQRLF